MVKKHGNAFWMVKTRETQSEWWKPDNPESVSMFFSIQIVFLCFSPFVDCVSLVFTISIVFSDIFFYIQTVLPLFPLFRLFFPGFIYSGCASLVLFIQVVIYKWWKTEKNNLNGKKHGNAFWMVKTRQSQSEW
jgi:hypothetical protein